MALLIAYGSLYPFHFTTDVDLTQARQALWERAGDLWTNFPDVTGNVLLFLPCGLLIAFMAGHAKAQLSQFFAWVMFALLVQIAQFWVPERSASLADVLWNGVGCAVGVVAGLAYRRLDAARDRQEIPFEPLSMIVALCWLGAELAPFVPSLDVGQVRSALRPLRDPFNIDFVHAGVVAVQFLVAAFALRSGVGRYKPALMITGMAAIFLGTKLFIVGHALHPGTLLGLGVGWLAFLIWRRRETPWGVLLGLLLVSYLLDSLAPFQFPGWQSDLHWLPLFARLEGSMLANLVSLLRIAYISLAVIWLLHGMQARVFAASVIIAICFAGVEYLQTWVAGRTGDMTEPFVLLLLAWVLRKPLVHADRAELKKRQVVPASSPVASR
ncbi:VanZ family protein [Viridibacterium curvum]|uniref:VanZ family protein n=1 Tax=Viridibacterium curvum TaxID=1101404 RepID=UPI0031EB46CF